MKSQGIVVAAIQLAVAGAIRAVCIVRHPIDSDEPQHLHLSREWFSGLVAYRDFYDNHLPLFHILFAPIIGRMPENGDILLMGRLAMLPLTIGALVLVWLIGSRLYDRDVAFWSVLLAAVFPPLVLKSIEFRNDNLWTILILGGVLLVLRGWHAAAGLVLALALLASIKTAPFAIGLAVAIVLVRGRASIRQLAIVGVSSLTVMTAAAWWLVRHGALDDLWRYAILANASVDVAMSRRVGGLILLASSVAAAFYLRRRLPEDRALVAVAIVVGAGAVFAVSPFIAPRDFLPYFALAAPFTAAAISWMGRVAHAVPAFLVITTVIYGEIHEPPDPTPRRRIEETIHLTDEDDPVLDPKGETVFRRRPTFLKFDRVGRGMVERGLVPESAPLDVIQRRCYVATGDLHLFPRATREFLTKHFVEWGTLRIAGTRPAANGAYTIVIPGHYRVVGVEGEIEPPRFLHAGSHRLLRHAAKTVVVWAGVPRFGKLGYDALHHRSRVLRSTVQHRAVQIPQRPRVSGTRGAAR